MKRILFILSAILLGIGISGCVKDENIPEPSDNNTTDKHYGLVYMFMLPKDMLRFVDVNLSFYDQTDNKNYSYTINETSKNDFEDKVFEPITSRLIMSNRDLFFCRYRVILDVKEGQKIEAKASWKINEEKVAALASNVTYTYYAPALYAFLNDYTTAPFGVSSGKISVSKDNYLKLLRERASEVSLSKTVKFE